MPDFALPLIAFVLFRIVGIDPTPHLPPLTDADRLPPLLMAASGRKFAKEHVDLAEAVLNNSPHRKTELLAAIDLARWHYHVWDTLENARRTDLPATSRREALDRLRYLVGPTAYHNVWLPAPAPWQHFKLID